MSEPSSIRLPPAQPSSGRRVFGIILMLLGIAMTVISGLCTGAFMVGDIVDGGRGGGGDVNLSGIEFIIGGPFILVGALMWWGGARLKRPRSTARHDVAAFGDPPAPPKGE